MTPQLDATHDVHARSWVDAANDRSSDFPVQNLPLGVFRRRHSAEHFRGGAAIGDQIVDLEALASTLPHGPATEALRAASAPALNDLMQLGPDAWHALRGALFAMLQHGSPWRALVEPCLVAQSLAEFTLPVRIGDYTDFYASRHHALAVGKLFRPENPLTPNYQWMPIAYHGRSSSIVMSGQVVYRPSGQSLPTGASQPVFGASRCLDYELEVGVFIGTGNAQGTAIPVTSAEQHIFGLCLLNDWSARDLQRWEAQPLGPFLGKNFATTISPWVVTLEALAPFRAQLERTVADGPCLPYLDSAVTRSAGAFDVDLSVHLETAVMRERGSAPECISHSNFRHAFWTVAQMIAHHTVGGCNLRCGDLLGSGTQSGPLPEQAGSLLELTAAGTHAIRLASGETRTFLEDGDRVVLRGRAEREGYASIGLGEATGLIMPAPES